MSNKTENQLSSDVIGAAIEAHKTLGGAGLLESIYEEALCHELSLRGLKFSRQVLVPVKYKNVPIKDHLCLDIIVEDKLIVEVKATEKEHEFHSAQLLTYLRITGKKLGLLINFGKPFVNDGIKRIANGL